MPAAPVQWHIPRALNTILSGRYTNRLLVFVPIGIAAGTLGWPVEAIFALNFLAIIPLAPLITFSIDELSPSVGHAFGELMKPTSGNAVEMIVAIIAVSRGQPLLARSSLLGSILAYALLVLGSSFFIAGYDKHKVPFDKTMTNTLSSLMMAVSFSLLVPTIMAVTTDGPESKIDSDARILSHAISITLLVIFGIYLNFRAWFLEKNVHTNNESAHENPQSAPREASTPTLNFYATSCILISTILCAILCAFHLVGSIDGLSQALNINKTFISLVLIPPVGYSARCVTITGMARRCQMDLVMRSIIHSILQITMLILPLMVLLGWVLEQPLTLDFNIFQATIFFLSLIVMTSTIQDGKANYFDGVMLIGTYVLIAAAFYVRPDVWESLIPPNLAGSKIGHLLAVSRDISA
ncbi:vacuolar calcium ion transporter /H(+) exchanger [Stipitochalara longipes BDJ]|nr:vacuolar calcium ion transporter /H(+) exchanger [Stipitochalara longipes BDJ]